MQTCKETMGSKLVHKSIDMVGAAVLYIKSQPRLSRPSSSEQNEGPVAGSLAKNARRKRRCQTLEPDFAGNSNSHPQYVRPGVFPDERWRYGGTPAHSKSQDET